MRTPRFRAAALVRDLVVLARRTRQPWAEVAARQDRLVAIAASQAARTPMGAERVARSYDERETARRIADRLLAQASVAVHSRDTADIAETIREGRPRLLVGPSRQLILIGEALRAEDLPELIATFGEVLTPENKVILRELFGAEPLDTYGMAEVGRIASHCRERDLYHVHHESLVVEVLDDDGEPVPSGDSGDLVVTTSWNPLVPLVRYRTGDRVTLSDRPCRCSHGHPTFSSIDGRTMDWFVDASGDGVAPQRLWISVHAPEALSAQVTR